MDKKWLSHRSDVPMRVLEPDNDWINPFCSQLQAVRDFRPPCAKHTRPPHVLVLYGTLRPAGISLGLGHEYARLGGLISMVMRVLYTQKLPVRKPALQEHSKVGIQPTCANLGLQWSRLKILSTAATKSTKSVNMLEYQRAYILKYEPQCIPNFFKVNH